MREMKDSGVEWIGRIPAHWGSRRLKYLSQSEDSLFRDGDWIESDVIEESGIRYLTTGNIGIGEYREQGWGHISQKTFEQLHCLRVVPEDILISRLNLPIGRCCLAPDTEDEYVVAVDVCVLRPDAAFSKRFLVYAMNTDGFAAAGESAARGSTMQRVSRSLLGNMIVPTPPLEEQEKIVSYLDERCAAIDEDVAKRCEVIGKLKEYKKSLIAHVVTKGLDSDAEMKDSGAEWIGKIPKSWEVQYPKALFALRNERMREEDIQLTASQEYGVVPQKEFQEREGRRVVQVILNPEILKHVEPGDFVMHMRSFQGGLEIAERSGCISSAYVMLHARNDKVRLGYFRYLFKSSTYIDALRSTSNLIRDGQALRYANFIQVYLPLPPADVQDAIASYLDKRCSAIDEAIVRQEQLIDKLGEYRKSIIHHAVTGKIDCTEG